MRTWPPRMLRTRLCPLFLVMTRPTAVLLSGLPAAWLVITLMV